MDIPPQLNELKKRLDGNERVLVFVGTGISRGATSAKHVSWQGLLNHGVNYLYEKSTIQLSRRDELISSIEPIFKPFNLEKVLMYANNITGNLIDDNGKNEFKDWLENCFSELKPEPNKSETLEIIKDLQRSGALIATTNYDTFLTEVTGLHPVSWEEHDDFIEAINKKDKILHLHGHWKRPSSIILNKESYGKIVEDEDFQRAFSGLWMFWSWIYLGCGSGLGDPNLGGLLDWGNRFEGSKVLPHYFLAKSDEAKEMDNHSHKPKNFVVVPFEEFPDLPIILRSITPINNSSPFVRVDENFVEFQDINNNKLVPSRQEFLDVKVPKLDVDDEVEKRLDEYAWAFVLDVGSVGKTTLALRIATSEKQRDFPVFYLDLKNFDKDESQRAISAIWRLSKKNILFILDNAHHNIGLAKNLWDEWNNNKSYGSKLLIVATKIQTYIKTEQGYSPFEEDTDNFAIEINPTEKDLVNLLNYIYFRILNFEKSSTPRLSPPADVLSSWHSNYGNALGAFCIAVRSGLSRFEEGNWDLPYSLVSEWVKDNWLNDLDKEDIENLICISVFDSQELEISVFQEALPYPNKTQKIIKKGLVEKIDSGRLLEHHQFSLRKSEWGNFILESQETKVDKSNILFTSALRDIRIASKLGSLLNEDTSPNLVDFWSYISEHSESVLQVYDYQLSNFCALVKSADKAKSPLVNKLWEAMKEDTEKFQNHILTARLSDLVAFLDRSIENKHDLNSIFEFIRSNPQKFSENALETSLQHVGRFFKIVKEQKQDPSILWEALEDNPNTLIEKALTEPLEKLKSFLESAKVDNRDISYLWDAVEKTPENFVERAWETSLDHLKPFLSIAEKHGRKLSIYWDVLEKDSDFLIQQASKASLEKLGVFMEVAYRQRPETNNLLWEHIESDSFNLSRSLVQLTSSLEHIAKFIEIADKQGRDISKFWNKVEEVAEKLKPKVKKMAINQLSNFAKSAPDNVLKIIIEDIKPNHWDNITESKSFNGAVGFAMRTAEIGREDLKEAIVKKLVKRVSNKILRWKDFPLRQSHLPSVSWVLSNFISSDSLSLEKFLQLLCTDRWLNDQYFNSNSGSLAKGLYRLTIDHPINIRRYFAHAELANRIRKDYSNIQRRSQEKQSEIIQLIGCTILFNYPLDIVIFDNTPDNLPSYTLSHRNYATKVESWQIQHWLGLRAIASLANKPLIVDVGFIEQTLNLWRINFEESSTNPESFEHFINREMISWLGDCYTHKKIIPTTLIQSTEK